MGVLKFLTATAWLIVILAWLLTCAALLFAIFLSAEYWRGAPLVCMVLLIIMAKLPFFIAGEIELWKSK